MSKKIVHIVGNRPQFIKLSPVSREFRRRGYHDIIIHTGQHYDYGMSDIFFEELDIPKPDYNLEIGSGSHAEMTGKAMISIEEKLKEIEPALVVLYGDTDSTLAGTLAARKLNIPIAHIEAGIRCYNKNNPEECNRIITDHMSDFLFCPDEDAKEKLKKENIIYNVHVSGDVMYDTFLYAESKNKRKREQASEISENPYVLMTWHRAENTSSREQMESILNFVEKIPMRVVCPLHPRTVGCLKNFGLLERATNILNLEIIEPVGYLEMVELMQGCCMILTDSGGLSKESSFAGIKCLFMVNLDTWIQLQEIGWITKVDTMNHESVNNALQLLSSSRRYKYEERPRFYGDGNASGKIVDILEEQGVLL